MASETGMDLGAFGSCSLLLSMCLEGGRRQGWSQCILAGARSAHPNTAVEDK